MTFYHTILNNYYFKQNFFHTPNVLSETVLGTLHMLAHSILTSTLPGRYSYRHFIVDETEAHRNLPEVTKLYKCGFFTHKSVRSKILISSVRIQASRFNDMNQLPSLSEKQFTAYNSIAATCVDADSIDI